MLQPVKEFLSQNRTGPAVYRPLNIYPNCVRRYAFAGQGGPLAKLDRTRCLPAPQPPLITAELWMFPSENGKSSEDTSPRKEYCRFLRTRVLTNLVNSRNPSNVLREDLLVRLAEPDQMFSHMKTIARKLPLLS